MRISCFLLAGCLIFAIGTGAQETEDPFQSLIEAIEAGEAGPAEAALDRLSMPLDQSRRAALQQTLARVAPSGEWAGVMRRLCEGHPQDAEFRYLLARVLWRAGDDKTALVECAKAKELAPENENILYRIAAIAYAANDYEKSKEWLNGLLEINSDNIDALLLYGTLLAREGKDELARQQLLSVLRIDPDNYLASFELGKLANRRGDSVEAERYLKQSIQGYPFFREAINALIIALSRQGKTEEVESLREVFDVLREWSDPMLNRMWYAFRNPDAVPTEEAQALAIELSKVKRPDLAQSYLRYRMSKNLASPGEQLLLVRLYYNQQDVAAAKTLIDQLDPALFEDSLLYAYLKTLIMLQTESAEETKAYYAEAVERFPESKELEALASVIERGARPASESNEHGKDEAKDYAIRFVDVTEGSGLEKFRHILGHADKRWIVDAMGSGVAVGDYDNDGDDDVYFSNGRPELLKEDPKWRNALYRNDGGRFVDVTEQAGVGDLGFGMAALFGDVNNDGHLDLFVGNIGANALYINNGDGTFRNATEGSGIDDKGYCAAAAFADVDQDGDLDLYVGNYVAFDPAEHGDLRFNYHGEEVFVGPLAFDAEPDHLYINNGEGVFVDEADERGFTTEYGRAMGGVFFDLDNDGDLDLYATNDSTFNHIYENKGEGRFEDVSFMSGGAFTESGVEGASMGIGPGDFNNDGFVDIYITSYERQTDVLFQSNGEGYLTDVSSRAGLAPTRMLITWGANFCDFNADGWQDAFTANGHLYPQVDKLDLDLTYNQGVSFYKNRDGRFEDVTTAALPDDFVPGNGRGSALFDYDLDGDMDLVINQIDLPPLLLENRSETGAWLQVKLDAPSAALFGARLVARKGERSWTRLVDGGSGYLSQNSSLVHFGFGELDSIDELTIHWNGKPAQTLQSPPLNSRIRVKLAEDMSDD